MSGMQTTNSPNAKKISLGPTHTFLEPSTGAVIPAVASNPLAGTTPTQFFVFLKAGLESTKNIQEMVAAPIGAPPTGIGTTSGRPMGTHFGKPKQGYDFIKINGQPVITNGVVQENGNTVIMQDTPSQFSKLINGTAS